MLSTIFNSQTVFVLNDAPDGTDSPSLEFSLLRDRQAGLTKREARRPYSATLRTKVAYTTTVTGAALRRLQGSLRALNTQPVVWPCFPFATSWADRATSPMQGGLMVVWKEDWSQYEIYTTADDEPEWPEPEDNWAPALMGFITSSQPEMLSADAATFKVEFTENSPAEYALIPPTETFDAGPQPAGYATAPKLLPLFPDFTRISEELRVTVSREQVGFTREAAATFYQHEVFRGQEADYTLVGEQPARLLRFFLDHAGPGASFWAASWLNVARLTQDIAAADTVLHVEDTSAIVVGDHLALYGDEFATAKVAGKTLNTITLTAAAGTNLSSDITCIFPLSLVRLDDPVLRLAWPSQNVALCSLPWTEQRAEYTPASDETLGTTLGKLATRVVLFEFTRDLRNGTVVTHRFTSFESPLSFASHTWASAQFSHGDIPQSLNLENDSVDITSFVFPGNPLLDDAAIRSEAPLSVTLRWADFDGNTLSNVATMFAGEVTEPSRDGDRITARAVAGPGVLDVQLPRLVHGLMCNHVTGANPDGSFLISAGCTLLRNDWKFTATVASPVSGAWPYELHLTSLARVSGSTPVYFLDWFALGFIEWGTGAALQRRYLLKSTIPSGGALTVKLQRWFEGDGPEAGDTVTLYPGCDGTRETCRAYSGTTNPTGKFNNYANYGGEPFTPAGNPSLLKLSAGTTQGGKK